jgi:hypothetical protein
MQYLALWRMQSAARLLLEVGYEADGRQAARRVAPRA